MPEIAAAPIWILLLLWPFQGEPCYPQIEGDLNEEFYGQALEHGIPAARRWYYREICRNLWALTWRWTTILVIVLPVLCDELNKSLLMPLTGSMIRLLCGPFFPSISWIVFGLLVNLTFVGLFLGVICSEALRGHERLLRIAFAAYSLGIATLIMLSYEYFQGSITIGRVWLLCLRSIWMPVCFSIGSIWVERHHRRHRAA